MARGKKKGRLSLILGLLHLLLGIGGIACVCLQTRYPVLSFASQGVALLAFTSGRYAMCSFYALLTFLGLQFLVYRKGRPFSYLFVPYSYILYFSFLVIMHRRAGALEPALLMSRISMRPLSLLYLLFFLEILLFLLLSLITHSLNLRFQKKMAFRARKEEAMHSDEDEDEPRLSPKELKKKAKEERKKAKAEAKKAALLAKRQAKEAKGRGKDEKSHDVNSRPVTVKNTASATVVMADGKTQKSTTSKIADLNTLSPEDPIAFPTFNEMPSFSTIEEKARENEVRMTQVPSASSVNTGAFDAVKSELEREDEDKGKPASPPFKVDVNNPQTFRKGGILEASLESLSRPVGEAEKPKKPIIGFDDGQKGTATDDDKIKSNPDFAPSHLSPSHPRYKLFASLRKGKKKEDSPDPEENEVTHFPSKPFEVEGESKASRKPIIFDHKIAEPNPSVQSLSEAIKSAEVYKEEEKKSGNDALYARFSSPSPSPDSFSPPSPVQEVKKSGSGMQMPTPLASQAPKAEELDEHELARDPGYYQGASTAKAVGDAEIADEKAPEPKEMPSSQIEFKTGVGGLSSNNAGIQALVDRAKRHYNPPPETLLVDYPHSTSEVDELTRRQGEIILQTMHEFRIDAELECITKGPTVAMFEFRLGPGILVQKLNSIQSNLSMSLGGRNVRILSQIVGKQTVGVEVPNVKRATVGFKEMMPSLLETHFNVPMILGKTITGAPVSLDVAKTPHMLIAGTTGSGKSVCINSLICSILYRKSPKEVRMIMVDPKIVELSIYNGISHLLTPVITDAKKVVKALNWLVDEMERRYKMMSAYHVRNIGAYNEKITSGQFAAEQMPYIVLIMDEFADLMTTIGKDIEEKVGRLAAMSRAVGIHIVMATQRPSSDVITGTIKNNIPTRIAFAVSSGMNSRIILDEQGAENLLGKGDMLYMNPAAMGLQRIQGAFLSDEEVEKIVNYVKSQGSPDYLDEALFEDDAEPDDNFSSDEDYSDENDDSVLYEKAKSICYERKSASASYLQRRMKIGYNRAARFVEQMEDEGIVGPAQGSKPREILDYTK